MLLDDFMPAFDVVERHHRDVAAPAERIFPLIMTADFADSWVIRSLYRLRGIPRETTTLAGAVSRMGFVLLGEKPDEEIVLGLTGKFWTPRGHIRRLAPAAFRDFSEPGWALAAFNVSLAPAAALTRVSTETRVRCTGPRSRRRFRAYWTFIGPFSAWIRREMLRVIAARAGAA
jgi:hypothetical protein